MSKNWVGYGSGSSFFWVVGSGSDFFLSRRLDLNSVFFLEGRIRIQFFLEGRIRNWIQLKLIQIRNPVYKSR